MIVVMPLWLLLTLVASWLTAYIASRKGMSFQGWFLWSLPAWGYTLPLVLLEPRPTEPPRPGWHVAVFSVVWGLVVAAVIVEGWEAR